MNSELIRLANIIRALRAEMFEPTRNDDWECQSDELRRLRHDQRRAAWDAETERMIAAGDTMEDRLKRSPAWQG